MTDFEHLIDFVYGTFPVVPYEIKEKAKECVAQFKSCDTPLDYLMQTPLEEISQGDVFSEIKFQYFDENGNLGVFPAKAIIVNTSCDIDNKDTISFAPLFNVESESLNKKAIKSNEVISYMYIPDNKLKDEYVNFGFTTTYKKKFIKQQIEKNNIKRIASLSQIGYYFFVVKYATFMLRKEDPETLVGRNTIN